MELLHETYNNIIYKLVFIKYVYNTLNMIIFNIRYVFLINHINILNIPSKNFIPFGSRGWDISGEANYEIIPTKYY